MKILNAVLTKFISRRSCFVPVVFVETSLCYFKCFRKLCVLCSDFVFKNIVNTFGIFCPAWSVFIIIIKTKKGDLTDISPAASVFVVLSIDVESHRKLINLLESHIYRIKVSQKYSNWYWKQNHCAGWHTPCWCSWVGSVRSHPYRAYLECGSHDDQPSKISLGGCINLCFFQVEISVMSPRKSFVFVIYKRK